METFFVLFTLFVLAPLAVFYGISMLKRAKAGTGNEMRASDLRALIERSVGEATESLQARITDLEERLGDEPAWSIRERLNPEAPARLGADALAAAFDTDDEEAGGERARRATRA